MKFSSILKKLREENNITQAQLANHLNVSRPTIAGYETKCRQPDYEQLEQIAEFFHVPIDYLIRGWTNEQSLLAKESTIDDEVSVSYQKLSLSAKQDVLKYIRLLELDEQ